MPRFTCRVAFVRSGLEARVSPAALPTVASLFEGAANGAGIERFRLVMDTSTATAHRLPSDLVTNSALLARSLERILGDVGRSTLGVTEVAVLFADKLDGHPGVLGMMFDTGFRGLPSDDAVPRQGCAVFLDAIRGARGNGVEYQREVEFTTAHELGHVFNLWHVQAPVSVMASSPGGRRAHRLPPAAFRPEHTTFLGHCAESPFVHPGGSRFGVRGGLGPPGGDFTNTRRDPAQVALAIHVEEAEFWPFEPVELDVSVTTRARRSVQLPDTLDPGYDEFVVWIEEPDGERRRYRAPRRYCRNVGTIAIRFDQPFRRDIGLSVGAGGYAFRVPGEHRLWVEWQIAPSGPPVRSNDVSVLVKTARPTDRGYRALARDLTHPGVARLLHDRVRSLRSGTAERLQRAAASRTGSSPAALEYALGRAILGQARTDARARARARRHLEAALRGLSRRTNRRRRALELLEQL